MGLAISVRIAAGLAGVVNFLDRYNWIMAEYGYTAVFEPLPEWRFSVLVPAIPEICPYGDTLEEAREMARDAIRCYLESVLETGEPIPGDLTH